MLDRAKATPPKLEEEKLEIGGQQAFGEQMQKDARSITCNTQAIQESTQQAMSKAKLDAKRTKHPSSGCTSRL